MIIRVLLILGLALTGWFVFLKRNRLPIHIVLVFALLALAAAAVLFPDITQDAANFVGVGRGADLVLYISVVAILFVLVHYYTKFVELQRKLTDMTREVAILRTELAHLTDVERDAR
jgi:hypothetical protein